MYQIRILFFLSVVSFAFGAMTAALLDKRTIFIKQTESAKILKVDLSDNDNVAVGDAASNLSGVSCEKFNRRPFAVMIAEDEEARPLSGIGLADIVIEMPVVTNSITRMMAVFGCKDPKEIGSVRSARHDFIPLAKGYDAILVHWGGSHFALEELGKKVVDNLDAMPNYFNAFFRKNWIPVPHNGFTSMRRMMYSAQGLGYRLTSGFAGYKFNKEGSATLDAGPKTLTINYPYPYNVKYEYNPAANLYYRWRAGKEEIDKVTQFQVAARNIAIMRAKSRQIEGDYNDVDIIGSGDAIIYRDGEEVRGRWVKKNDADVLRFWGKDNLEISFTPGSIWIEIAEPGTVVRYE